MGYAEDLERLADLGYTISCERVTLWTHAFSSQQPCSPADAAKHADACLAEFDERFRTIAAPQPEFERQKEA